MLFFRNDTIVPLFCPSKNENCPALPTQITLSKAQSLSLALFSTYRWAVQNWSAFVTRCLMVVLKGKSVVKIGMQYGKLITDERF